MNDNITSRLTELTLACVICVLIIVAVAIPIFTDAQHSIKSTTMNTTEVYAYNDGSDIPNMSLMFDISEESFLINDEVVYEGVTDYNLTIITDKFSATLLANGQYVFFGILADDTTSKFYQGATDLILVIEDKSVTATINGSDVDMGEISYIYYPNKNGTYGLFTSDYYLTKGSKAIAYVNASSGIGTSYLGPEIIAEYDEATGEYSVISAYTGVKNSNVAVSEISNVVISNPESTGTDEHNVKMSRVTASATVGPHNAVDAENFANLSMKWIAPIQYEYIDSSDNTMITMISIIPILMVIALILGVVSAVFYYRTK